MKFPTIEIEFGIDTAFIENIDIEKYLRLAAKSLRKQLPEYQFRCSVHQGDNAETAILNLDNLNIAIADRVRDAVVEAESEAINDPDAYEIFNCTQVAIELGVHPSRVRALAKSRNIGNHLGHIWIFTQADIEEMRIRKPGKPPLK